MRVTRRSIPPSRHLAPTRLVNEISQLSDVGSVDVSGPSLPAVRVRLSPARMAAYGLTFGEARRQLTAANSRLDPALSDKAPATRS
ncbi:efflux RND transporter permease subunit [Burkholderia multivorans]|uniref:efflux RND transporter permease subunit n=1 Tax=Burkholderia multivorans TaxID=87883 RepID=UPI001561F8BC|nr:efflux RND transporter permease subunit [Burkholderia multivorans]